MQDAEVCRYLSWTPPKALDETLALVRQAETLMAPRESGVFAQIWKATGRAIGSTRLLRDPRLCARRAQDRRAQRPLAGSDRPTGRRPRGHVAQAHERAAIS